MEQVIDNIIDAVSEVIETITEKVEEIVESVTDNDGTQISEETIDNSSGDVPDVENGDTPTTSTTTNELAEQTSNNPVIQNSEAALNPNVNNEETIDEMLEDGIGKKKTKAITFTGACECGCCSCSKYRGLGPSDDCVCGHSWHMHVFRT